MKKKGTTFYISKSKDVAFEYKGSGLWGPIYGVLALKSDLKKIKGITIVHQEETPGLGGRISEEEYLKKFIGKIFSPVLVITKPDTAKGDHEVDGITGATLSCSKFGEILNNEFRKNVSIYKENK